MALALALALQSSSVEGDVGMRFTRREIDPVCGQPVAEGSAETSEYRSRRYYFCSGRCRRGFEGQAERMRAAELARLGALFGNTRRARWGMA